LGVASWHHPPSNRPRESRSPCRLCYVSRTFPAARGATALQATLNLLVEIAFGLVFVGTLVVYLRRRDPLAREVALAFSGLALLLVLQLLRAVVDVPAIAGRVATILLLAQPVFVLRLLDQVRPTPARLLPTAYLLYAVLALPLLVLESGSPSFLAVALAAVGVFLVLQVMAAAALVAESRRRSGSARMRLFVAGIATALMAVAILVLLFGLAGDAVEAVAGLLARVIALVAAIGYAIAFLPPPFVRRSWQASAAYAIGRRLLETADAGDPAHTWQRLAELAAQLTGAEAAVVRSAEGAVRAAVGMDRPRPVGPADLDRLTASSSPPLDLPLAEAGRPWTDIGATVHARFLTVVPIPESGARRSVLLLYGRRRSLFGEDDRELLAALGTQAAILAERAALAADLRRTVEELRSASAAKSDFLASMSHELRTPLNAIIGFSELMRMEPPDRDRVAVPTEWIGHVANAGQHLLDLINDVLDLAKVEAGRLDLDPARFDLDAAALEWVGGVRPLADRKGVRLSAEGAAGTVTADRGRLRQIVYNLLSNAIKFTPPGGEVRVEIARDGEGVRLAVVDTGIGIAPEDHEAVFEEFRQVGRPSDRQPGTGLGLALTRRLVEAHGGRMELESALGAGSRFTVHLPDGTGAVGDVEPAPELVVTEPGPNQREILVIEDDPGAVRLLRESLAPAGWHVRAAGDGPEGLVAARERRPDAIVLDVLLPGMDGWDVLRALKADQDLRDVPVLMLTVVDEREVGLALGAADYLVKPVDRAELLERLARFTFTTKVREREVRVLVVDDDPRAVEMLSDGLEQEGFVVTRAHSGRQAIDLARSEPPDVVVCDLVMPDVDGFALVRALKADPRTRDAPILVVTGHDISAADKARLNGDILGIVDKGSELTEGLRRWLGHVTRTAEGRSPAG
jgi:signal transduction histidine kinase/CheY-like chemotaxis protein